MCYFGKSHVTVYLRPDEPVVGKFVFAPTINCWDRGFDASDGKGFLDCLYWNVGVDKCFSEQLPLGATKKDTNRV